jgi:hypothetical protein
MIDHGTMKRLRPRTNAPASGGSCRQSGEGVLG